MATSTNLNVSFEQSSGLERQITVRVPNAEIEREIDSRLARLGKTAKIKGFRPGKVPLKVVRQRYGQDIRQEVLGDVIRSSFAKAVAQEQLNPAGGPQIEPVGAGDDEHFAYRATFEVYPEIELNGVESLKVEIPEVTIGPDDVDAMIEKLREQRAEWHEVERKSADGDRVVVDFQGTMDKQPFEGGKGEGVTLELGAGQVIEDFEKALKGVAAGEDKTAKIKFPKDYPAAELAGKKAQFEIHVQRVEEKVLPEVDDAFLQGFGIDEGGVDALKRDVEKNMQRELDERLRAERKSRTLDAFLDANPLTVPKALIDQEIRELQADAMRRLGVDDPSKAPPPERFAEHARRRVALGLLVQELIRANDIELDPARVDARIEELVAPYEQPEEAARLYRNNAELIQQVQSTVLEEQVVDFLLDKGRPSKKTLGFADFMGA